MSPHLQHLAWTLARCLSGLLGITFLYMALFMYQDDRGRLQNRLVDLWLEVQTREESALTRHSVLIRKSSELALRGLERLFGTRLVSARAIVISASLSLCSAYLVLETAGLATHSLLVISTILIFGVYGFFLGPHLFNHGSKGLALLSFALVCTATYLGAYLFSEKFNYAAIIEAVRSDGVLLPKLFAVGCLFGLLCDLLILLVNRILIKAMSRTQNATLLVVGVLYNLSWALLLADSLHFIIFFLDELSDNDPLALAVRSLLRSRASANGDSPILVIWSFGTNLFTALTASSVVFILLIALVHRFTWPIVGRTLNAVYEWEIMSSRKVQFSAATGFLLFSIPQLSTLFSQRK